MSSDKVERIVIRHLWPHERAAYRDHLLRLDDEDRRMRFGGTVRDDFIRSYCAGLDWSRLIVIVGLIDGELRAAGELRLIDGHPPARAEIAITVEKPFQNKGLGSEILRRLIVIARNRSIRCIYMVCLPENLKMRRLARKFDSEIAFLEGDVEGRITPLWPDYASLLVEALDESQSLIQSTLGGAPLAA